MEDNLVEDIVRWLRLNGVEVERADFPPPPFPGLYVVNGHTEMTELQVINYAYERFPRIPPIHSSV